MILWLDAQLPPMLASWLNANFRIQAFAIRDVGMRDARDLAIYQAAKNAGAIIVSKDSDFVELVERHGIPPHLIWLTCGNVTNAALETLLSKALADAINLIAAVQSIVEITTNG